MASNLDEEVPICGGDLIMLKHSETEGFLTSEYRLNSELQLSEVFLRNYKGEFEKEKFSVSSLWEIEIDEGLLGKGTHC